MPVSALALIAVLVASVVAAGLSVLAARSSRRHPGVALDGPWWGALAVGLADVTAHLGVATPAFPPSDVTDRIPIVAIAGMIVAAILAGGRGVLWARLVGYGGLAALAYLVILEPVLGAGESSEETILQLAIIAGVSLLAMLNIGLLDAPQRRSELWVALTILAGGSGLVLILANSAVLFLLAGTLALVMAVSLAGAWGLPVGGGIPVASTVLTSLVIVGSVYAFLPLPSALLLAGSPLMLWLLRFGPLARLSPKVRTVVASGLILIPVVVAIVLAYLSRADDGYGI